MFKKSTKAFTLIELLVVIAIIGILATISVLALSNARAKSRDAKRAGDIKQIQTALELFFNDNNRYPTAEEWNTGKIYSTSTGSTSTYMQIIPTAPTPADGTCTNSQNSVVYIPTIDGSSYSVSFCLGNTTGTLAPGPKCLTPGGIISVNCGSFSLNYAAGSNGSLAGNLSQLVDYNSSGSAITAVPIAGYHFVDWSDGSTQNPRTDNNVNGNISVVANFEVNPFACGVDTVNYGGQIYSTVQIGSQCWFKENLNVGSKVAGSSAQGDFSAGIQKYCHSNLDNNCVVDGGLYQWHMAMGLPAICDNHDNTAPCTISGNVQGVCPSGWHVPSDSDWNLLIGGLGGNLVAGGKMKEAGTAHWNSPNTGADNSSGFTALSTGHRWTDGAFYSHGIDTYLWSSLPDSSPNIAWNRYLNVSDAGISNNNSNRAYGGSVRCLMD